MSTKDSDQEDAEDVLSTTLGDRYPSENKQEVSELYDSNPRLLDAFTTIMDFVAFFQKHPLEYDKLCQLLKRITLCAYTTSEEWDIEQRIQFMVVVGFVDKAVEMYLQLRKEMGYFSMPEIRRYYLNPKMMCVHDLILKFEIATRYSARFCLCLARLGVLQKLMEDLRHLQNMCEKVRERGTVYECSSEILLNCCAHPQVLPIVRDLGAVDNVRPFLAQRNERFRMLTLMTLAFLINDSERSLLQLDSDVFDFFCCTVEKVLADEADAVPEWSLDMVLFALSACAQLDHNRKILSTDIFLHMLAMILQNRKKEEKVLALAILRELEKNSESLQDIAKSRPLRKALDDLQCSADQTMAQEAATVLSILPAEGKDYSHLTALLADQRNMLTTGVVDFVINQLTKLCPEGDKNDSTGDVAIHQNTGLCSEGDKNDCTGDVAILPRVEELRAEARALTSLAVVANNPNTELCVDRGEQNITSDAEINQNTELCAEGGEQNSTSDAVINQNTELCAEGGGHNCSGDVSLLTVLQALAELAEKSDTAKEIVDKGGIEALHRCCETKREDAEKVIPRHCLRVLRQLSYHKECCDTLKVFPDLADTIANFQGYCSCGVRYLASDILKNIIPEASPELAETLQTLESPFDGVSDLAADISETNTVPEVTEE